MNRVDFIRVHAGFAWDIYCSAWLTLPVWKVRDRGFELHSGLQVSKKENVSSPLTRNVLLLLLFVLWGTSVTKW